MKKIISCSALILIVSTSLIGCKDKTKLDDSTSAKDYLRFDGLYCNIEKDIQIVGYSYNIGNHCLRFYEDGTAIKCYVVGHEQLNDYFPKAYWFNKDDASSAGIQIGTWNYDKKLEVVLHGNVNGEQITNNYKFVDIDKDYIITTENTKYVFYSFDSLTKWNDPKPE